MLRTIPVALAALMVGGSAHAATLSISNGFLKNVVSTSSGYAFDMGDSGYLSNGTTSVATSLSVSCTLDTSTDDLDCSGTMGLGSTTTPISITFDAADGAAVVAIPKASSAAKRAAVRTWTRDFILEHWLPGGDDDDTDTGGGGGGGGGGCDPVPPDLDLDWIFEVKMYRTSYCSDVTVILDGVVVSALWW